MWRHVKSGASVCGSIFFQLREFAKTIVHEIFLSEKFFKWYVYQ